MKKAHIESLKISGIILAVLLVAIPFVLAYLDKDGQIEVSSVEDVVNQCQSSSLKESGICAVQATKSFYKYNIENVGRELDFETLRKEGGVCSSWADYYNEIGNYLGFKTKNIIVNVSGNIYHEFNVWSNDSGYCILDQTEISCVDIN